MFLNSIFQNDNTEKTTQLGHFGGDCSRCNSVRDHEQGEHDRRSEVEFLMSVALCNFILIKLSTEILFN